ncbi:MAG: formate dehydrogenase subunit gamma [Rhodospirillales bacterium]
MHYPLVIRQLRLLYPQNTSVQEDRLAAYEPWNESRATEIIAAKVGLEGAALPILHDLQHAFGCVPTDAVPMVAKALNLSRAEVHGIVTFYHEFRRTPPGRHVLHLCRAEACQALGADKLGTDLRAKLGVDWHGTTEDGAVTLEPVFCLGLCAIGPAALLDGAPLARLDAAKVAAALEAAP